MTPEKCIDEYVGQPYLKNKSLENIRTYPKRTASTTKCRKHKEKPLTLTDMPVIKKG